MSYHSSSSVRSRAPIRDQRPAGHTHTLPTLTTTFNTELPQCTCLPGCLAYAVQHLAAAFCWLCFLLLLWFFLIFDGFPSSSLFFLLLCFFLLLLWLFLLFLWVSLIFCGGHLAAATSWTSSSDFKSSRLSAVLLLSGLLPERPREGDRPAACDRQGPGETPPKSRGPCGTISGSPWLHAWSQRLE